MKSAFGRILPTLVLAVSLISLHPAGAAGRSDREPVWAGRFYPATASAINEDIDRLQERCGPRPQGLPGPSRLRALILPHAGYVYSGQTAACGARILEKGTFGRVILAGPDHRVGFAGGAISDVDGYRTPLGRIPLDAAAGKLRENGLFRSSPASDAQEHSLEVILPFLQRFLGDFSLVPVVMGPADPKAYARALSPLVDGRTLLVVSSDLSHYLPYDEAVAKDRKTIEAVLNLDERRLAAMENAACGKLPILTLMELARQRNWRPVALNYTNSGDTAGDRSRVVGYVAIAFFQQSGDKPKEADVTDLDERQGEILVDLARSTIAEALGVDATAPAADTLAAPPFQARQGTFVTLTLRGRLRGCIGNLSAAGTLAESVRRNALNAAFRDPRFRPLTVKEFDSIQIEISVLTPSTPLAYADAKDLVRRLRPLVDGVTIRKGTHSATFLPQVWDQLPDPESFLGHLCQKAGLRADEWRSGRLDVETYQVRHFEE